MPDHSGNFFTSKIVVTLNNLLLIAVGIVAISVGYHIIPNIYFYAIFVFLLLTMIFFTVYLHRSAADITQLKTAEHRLLVQYVVACALANAKDFESAAHGLLQSMCESMDWEFGAIWMVNQKTKSLSCLEVWYNKSLDLSKFVEITKSLEFEEGVGLPGGVWQSAKPRWISEIAADPSGPRAAIGINVGLHSGIGFPIWQQEEVLGVIELFTCERQEPDDDFLQTLMTLGAQIGQFIARTRVENELRASEAYKTAVLESARDAIVTIDMENKILSINRITTEIFKFLYDELVGVNIQVILPDLKENLFERTSFQALEMNGVRRDKTTFPSELTLSRTHLKDKEIFVVVIRDITERKKIEQLKDEFVSMVSHELRTPLTSIRGSLSLILGGASGEINEKTHKLLDIANTNCERLIRLINDILDIEKIEANKMLLKLEPTDLCATLDESIAINTGFAEKYSVSLKLVDNVPNLKVNVDRDRLLQVITNLISNAVKYSPTGGEVSLSVKIQGKSVRVGITDQGSGIPEEFQASIFGKFSQADSSATRQKGGTGLGLNICKALVEKMGGTIGFTTKANAGTTFFFELPLS
ncbi:MAG: ATP-binding protein [Gammaproteobacteria bacterium]